ncbi:MAG: hypothetical protein QOE23_3584 [Pseudonocardiales bacterium]|jgi:nucleoid-associated protein YgaU|nr:hypothetical protein [Pseudonocardiales bacterium]
MEANEKAWLAQTRLVALVAGTGLVLVSCPPRVAELADGVRSPWRWVAELGPDAAVGTVAGALLWLVALWVALGLAVTAGSRLPGRLGQFGSAAAHRLTPAALRRVVAAATSTSILLSPATALAAPSGSGAPTATGSAPTAAASGAPSAAGTSSLPPVGWPTDPGPAPRTAGDPLPGTERAAVPTGAGRVRVRAGDSLWSIAGHRLGPAAPAGRIQQEWPRWYALNRQLIGPDPNLIRPGTRLRIPEPSQPAPSHPHQDTVR